MKLFISPPLGDQAIRRAIDSKSFLLAEVMIIERLKTANKTILDLAESDIKVEKFIQSREKIHAFCGTQLSEGNFPAFPMVTASGKILTVFSQYKGAASWEDYRPSNPPDTGALENACQNGVYDAWMAKLPMLVNSAKAAGKEGKRAMTELLENIALFNEQFLTVGYLMTGKMLMDLAKHFKTENNSQAVSVLIAAAMENFCVGTLLAESEPAAKLMEFYYPKGWTAIFSEYADEWAKEEASRGKSDLPLDVPVQHLMGAISENFSIPNPEIFFGSTLKDAEKISAAILDKLSGSDPSVSPDIHSTSAEFKSS